MQPLFEHRLELAGYETRVLELEGESRATLKATVGEILLRFPAAVPEAA